MTGFAMSYRRAFWACLLVSLTGCATKDMSLTKALPWPGAGRDYETPEKVIAIWTDAVYQLPGKEPTRGFGGRVYFYNSDDEVIPVDGELVIYAFDDSDPHATLDKPSRRYAFTAEQLTHYYSESEIGASYNIWIPWDTVGGAEKQIALFPVFVDNTGKNVRGTFANNRLPGKRVLTDEEKRGFYISRKRRQGAQVVAQQESGVRPAGYDAPAAPTGGGDDDAQPGMVTHTIRVPRSLSERMATNTALVPQSPSVMTLPGPAGAAPAQPAAGQPATTPQETAPLPGQAPGAPAAHTFAPPMELQQAPAAAYQASPAASGWNGSQPNAGPPTVPQQMPAQAIPNSAYPAAGEQTPHLGQQGFIGADPQYSTSARSRAWARQDLRAARFEPPQFRAPTSPDARSRLGRAPLSRSLTTPQYSPPPTR